LARAVMAHAEKQSRPFRPLYDWNEPVPDKILAVAQKMYGARSVVFAKAAELWERAGEEERRRLEGLRAGLESALRERLPEMTVNCAGSPRLPNTLHVTLPGLRVIILVALALDMVWEFRRFALVLTMTGGGPGTLTEVLSTLVYKSYFQFFTFEYASAIAILMSVVLLLLSLPYIVLVGRAER